MQAVTRGTAMALADLSLTVLYDNRSLGQGLATGWGFSCLVRDAAATILFDTGGDGPTLLANMEQLAIDPDAVDTVVLSHAHGDHTGGLAAFLKANRRVRVFLLRAFPEGFKRALRQGGIDTVEVASPAAVSPAAFSTGELGTSLKEQSLIVRTEEGNVVLTGCAHPGLTAIVGKARELCPGEEILLLTGGFHLLTDDPLQLEKASAALARLGVCAVGPAHCTGEAARLFLQRAYRHRCLDVGVGRVIHGRELAPTEDAPPSRRARGPT